MPTRTLIILIYLVLTACKKQSSTPLHSEYSTDETFITISRTSYKNQLQGFWLGQSIANWTGLVTEMDKIGNIGDIKTGEFYTSKDWNQPDLPSIWGHGIPSELSPTISFVFRDSTEVWGSDDDTDIEYMYQYLMHQHQTSILSPQQIRNGWFTHIKSEEENYLWVSNQRAFDLMRNDVLPPNTGHPDINEHYDMIDAQLTTELFGLLSPTRPDIAHAIAELPIKTTASHEAEDIAQFYIHMHALASLNTNWSLKERLNWMANEARKTLKDTTYPAQMFDYVKHHYESGLTWEQTRDSIYNRYQVQQKDGYTISSRNLYCNGCFAAGINFAASLVSLFYGEGHLKNTIKIGTLTGWDSDNPTATWGGLIGFMMGKDAIETHFNRSFSTQFNIHRTRQNFPNNGIDTFSNMAQTGIEVIDLVVQQQMNGHLNTNNNTWEIPKLPNTPMKN